MPHVSTNGVKLYYEEKGVGRPLFLLHCYGLDHRIFSHQFDFFSRYFRTITIDYRGHGLSNKPNEGYKVENYFTDIINAIDKLTDKKEIIYIIGHSLGGMLGLKYALLKKEKVKKLVLVNTPPTVRFSASGFWLYYIYNFAYNIIPPFPGKILRHAIQSIIPDTAKLFVAPFLAIHYSNLDQTRREHITEMVSETPMNVLVETILDILSWDITSRLTEISCSTLVIFGVKDYYINDSDIDYYRKSIKKVKVIKFQKTGHSPQYEAPDKFNKIVFDFLKE